MTAYNEAGSQIEVLKNTGMDRERGPQEYADELGIDTEELRSWLTTSDGPVLDICSGANNLANQYNSVKIVGLDIEPRGSNMVQGRAQELPFKDESFAKIISCKGLFLYAGLETDKPESVREDIENYASEAYRVLKSGGELWLTLWPVLDFEVLRPEQDKLYQYDKFMTYTLDRKGIYAFDILEILKRVGFSEGSRYISKKSSSISIKLKKL